MNNSDAPPPFLPLEESNDADEEELLSNDKSKRKRRQPKNDSSDSATTAKRLVGLFIVLLVLFLLYDSIFTPPEKRLIKPDASDRFLRWVQRNPGEGIIAFMVVIGSAVVLLLPVGTPLTIGCGFVYKTAYGWKLGVFIATVVSMAGSAGGACTSFLLGRYLLRDHVKKWIKNYPLFVAIDIGT